MDAIATLFKGRAEPYQIGAPRRPVAAILTCADARVVPELIFGRVPGDLFTVRLPGPIVTPEVAAALEMACGLGCPSILVLGHTDCRALWSQRERALEHHAITSHISWATRNLPPGSSLEQATAENVRHAVSELRSRLHASIEGAVFDLLAGRLKAVSC